MNRKIATAAAAGALVLCLSACGRDEPPATATPTAPVSEPSAPPAEDTLPAGEEYGSDAGFGPIEDPSVASGPGFDSPAGFGETVVFPGGVEVTVESQGIRPVSEDDLIESAPGDVVASWKVTYMNNTGARLDVGLLWPSTAYGENFEQSGSVIENASFDGMFPGESMSGTISRMLPESEADRVRIYIPDPNMMGPDAIFEGSALE